MRHRRTKTGRWLPEHARIAIRRKIAEHRERSEPVDMDVIADHVKQLYPHLPISMAELSEIIRKEASE